MLEIMAVKPQGHFSVKPVYEDQSILEISNTSMYECWYHYLTDSFIIHV